MRRNEDFVGMNPWRFESGRLAWRPWGSLAWLLAGTLAFAWACIPVFGSGEPLSRNAPVLSGCEVNYPPYCIVTRDGEADGFSVELLRAALKAVGREARVQELKREINRLLAAAGQPPRFASVSGGSNELP